MFRAKEKTFGRGLASNAIARSFAISLMLHFILIAGLEFGRKAGLWEHSVLPKSLGSDAVDLAQAAEQQRQAGQQQEPPVPEADLVFIEIDPEQAVVDEPENAKFYSTENTLAADAIETLTQEAMPKIDGQQEQVPKTMDVLRPAAEQMQPAQPEQQEEEQEQPAPQPEPAEAPREEEQPGKNQSEPQPQERGETMLARAAPRPQPRPRPPEARRPYRSLAQAKADKGLLAGEKMKQEGNANRFSLAPSHDVRKTPFAAYDLAFINAVQTRWFNILEERGFVGTDIGRVVLEFRLNYDGRILSMRVVESEVNELLAWFCQRAVLDPAPYMPFPPDLRRRHKTDYREIRFTFFYNQ